MQKHIGIFLFIFLLIPVFALSEELVGEGGTSTIQSVDSANRFLSAEVARQFKDMSDQVKANQDANVQWWDESGTVAIAKIAADVKTKVILGSIGASLLAGGLVAFFMFRTAKKYSYETYLKSIIDKQQVQLQVIQPKELQPFQQKEWRPQTPTETMGMKYGQKQASNMTQMNQWQGQPAYFGAWQAPVETKSESSVIQKSRNKFDPMDVGWSPKA